MKILFAIQGTGNGHLSRARDIYPELVKYGEVDVLISGIQADVDVPFPVKYKLYGMSFIFGNRGGVDIWKTVQRLNVPKLVKDIRKLPVKEYDIVINDFEPVSAWACKFNKVRCISLSHQSAVLNRYAPLPKRSDWLGKVVLKHYAPTDSAYGFHFKNFDKGIYTPVIRREIRNAAVSDAGHYTVYLPAYDDETLVTHLSYFRHVQWQVFSKHNKNPFIRDNVSVQPIENSSFIKSMASSRGVLCGAGFEGPAEAMYLGKKVLAIPMQAQYEQQCNAAALDRMGVMVIGKLDRQYYDRIKWWILAGKPVNVQYPDIAGEVVAQVMKDITGSAAN